ncbi:MAG: hypothetical protein DRP78_04210, partial [Candidatus Omnitrophota bacterium]
KIIQKLILGFMVVAVLVGVVGYVGLRSLENVNKIFIELKEDIIPGAVLMAEMQTYAAEVHLLLMECMVYHHYNELIEEIKFEFAENKRKLIKAAQKHYAQERHIGDLERIDAQKFLNEIETMNFSADMIIAYIDSVPNAGHTKEFHKSVTDKEKEEFHPKYEILMAHLVKHKAEHMQEFAAAKNSVSQIHDKGRRAIFLSSIFTFFFAIVISFFISRSISRPIIKLKNVTAKIIKGDLSARAEGFSKDEIGALADSFNKMTQDLLKTTVSKDYVENVIGTMMDCLIVINPDATIKTVNKAACLLLGYKEEELIGKNVSLIVTESESESESESEIFSSAGLKELIVKAAIKDYEMLFKTKYGRMVSMLVSGAVMKGIDCPRGTPISDCPEFKKKGQHCEYIIGIVCVAKDVTERRKAEAQIRKNVEDMEQFNRVMMDREGRVLGMKKEVNDLLLKSGQDKKYETDESSE